jgi:hypothetical protein
VVNYCEDSDSDDEDPHPNSNSFSSANVLQRVERKKIKRGDFNRIGDLIPRKKPELPELIHVVRALRALLYIFKVIADNGLLSDACDDHANKEVPEWLEDMNPGTYDEQCEEWGHYEKNAEDFEAQFDDDNLKYSEIMGPTEFIVIDFNVEGMCFEY